MKNTTIEKNMEFLRWFLRWSLQKGFHKNAQFEAFRPKFKKTQKKVIFLQRRKSRNWRIQGKWQGENLVSQGWNSDALTARVQGRHPLPCPAVFPFSRFVMRL
jgi:hypothetical protein